MSSDPVIEVVFVGLPGPTHHYGGLSTDNKASTLNRGSVSNPKQAALQALELVWLLKSMGIVTAILPPQLRPSMPLLRQHFKGEDEAIIAQAATAAPALLEKACAASSMWTANAATVTPGVDAADGRLHITTANLFTNMHRRIEAEDTFHVLSHIFKNVPDATVHPPLSAMMGLRDEGAANHMRLAPTHSDAGLNVFVYGTSDNSAGKEAGRQTLSASQGVALQHRLTQETTGFIRQNREAIKSGVFHNDVIAVSNENVLLVHEQAYDQGLRDIELISEAYREFNHGKDMSIIVVGEEDLTMDEAVQTYFFNSQIVTKPDRSMALIAPIEVKILLEGWGADMMERIRNDSANPINEVHYVDLRQSMRNGGGPACLRLRVPMTHAQLAAMSNQSRVVADDYLIEALERVINTHYPDAVTPADLGNPELYHCSRKVMQALSDVMQLPLI
jgi:succinylarginine dihydrolase